MESSVAAGVKAGIDVAVLSRRVRAALAGGRFAFKQPVTTSVDLSCRFCDGLRDLQRFRRELSAEAALSGANEGAPGDPNDRSMTFRARVVNGQIVIDQPATDLPEGTVLDLTIADDDELDDEEKARLEAALEKSWAQAEAGNTRPAADLLRDLRSK